MRKSTLSVLFSAMMLLSIILVACTPPAAPAAPTTAVQPTAAVVEVTKEVQVTQQVVITNTPAPDKVQIYWYIGLGAGSQPAQIPLEKAFADKFNASQSEIQLIPIIVDNKYARDNLTAQIAARQRARHRWPRWHCWPYGFPRRLPRHGTPGEGIQLRHQRHRPRFLGVL